MARLRDTDALLVRMPNWLGDFVMAEPVVASLARACREGRFERLALAGPERFFDLFAGRFEGIARLDKDGDWRGYDAALFLDGSWRSLWRAMRAGIDVRLSWASGGRFVLATESVRPALERGGVPLGLGARGRFPRRLPRPFGSACAELTGLLGVPVIERAPRLVASDVAKRAAGHRLEDLGLPAGSPYLLLDASARPDSAKAAPASLWIEVLDRLARAGAPPVVLASAPGESVVARELHAAADPKRTFLFDVPPPTLGELLALVEDCELFMGTDSGPRHLAVASGRPAVILCGPTDPRHTADHTGDTWILRRQVDCGPCHEEVCPLEELPDRGACMATLEVDAIVEAANRVLAGA